MASVDYKYLNEILTAIMTTKNEDVFDESKYNIAIINNNLAGYIDLIDIVNFLNQHPFLDKKIHFKFLLNMISPRKKEFVNYIKPDIETLAMISDYYDCSLEKAADTLQILTNEQVDEIKTIIKQGGVKEYVRPGKTNRSNIK